MWNPSDEPCSFAREYRGKVDAESFQHGNRKNRPRRVECREDEDRICHCPSKRAGEPSSLPHAYLTPESGSTRASNRINTNVTTKVTASSATPTAETRPTGKW